MWVTVAIVSLVAVAVLVGLAMLARKMLRRSMLRSQYGDEYQRVVQQTGDRKVAERELLERRRRVKSLKLRSLDEAESRRFGDRWRAVQARFVDAPGPAVDEAHWLLEEVMKTRGFPAEDERHIHDDMSALRPGVAASFRRAREIAHRNRAAGATTEELREAMVHYKELFEVLIDERAHARRSATA